MNRTTSGSPKKFEIVLVSADFGKELTTAVMWLNDRDLDIRCIRLKPYNLDGRILIDTQQIIPLPEAAEYQIQIREKEQRVRAARTQKRQWDEESFFEELGRRCSPVEVDVAGRILEWTRQRMGEPWWGKGRRSGSFVPVFDKDDLHFQLFAVWTSGAVEIYFYWYAYKPRFESQESRLEVLRKLNAIKGLQIPEEAINKRPSIPLKLLHHEAVLGEFLKVMEWITAQVQSHSS